MAKLSKDQLAFIKQQNFSPANFFDVSGGMSKEERKLIMGELELYFYFGGAVCKKGGHSLREKDGHCIQCDTSQIAYQLRNRASGSVYLLYSSRKRLVKVGFTIRNPVDRASALRAEGYGGADDWEVRKEVYLEQNGGKAEFEIHSLLGAYVAPVVYQRPGGREVECREIFSCPLKIAVSAFEKAIPS